MASANPRAVDRFRAKIDTSVDIAIRRSTDNDPTMASPPTTTGSAAASRPPNTHTSTAKLTGIAIDSITSTSRSVCELICEYTIAEPPANTVTSRCLGSTDSDTASARACAR